MRLIRAASACAVSVAYSIDTAIAEAIRRNQNRCGLEDDPGSLQDRL